MTRLNRRILPFVILAVVMGGMLFLSPAQAQSMAGSIPTFQPSIGWRVGATGIEAARGLSGGSLPCVMTGEYDNGFVVRLSGGSGQMLAMAVDFRQNIFRQGARYDAAVSVNSEVPVQIKGSAFTSSVLVFNVRDVPGFYNALQAGQFLNLAIGTNTMRFSLAGIDNGFRLLETCVQNGPAQAGQMTQQAMMGGNNTMGQMGTPASMSPAPTAMPQNLNDITSAPMGAPQGWEDKPEDVYIRRADSQRAAALQEDNHPDINNAMKAAQSPRPVAPPANTAVSASPRFSPEPMGDAYASTPGGYASGLAGTGYSGAGGQWSAAQGSGLQTVLQSWSSRNNVRLIWNADRNFALKQGVSQGGSYESALQSVLGQFSSDSERPVGRLNTDPNTGMKLLIIDTDRS